MSLIHLVTLSLSLSRSLNELSWTAKDKIGAFHNNLIFVTRQLLLHQDMDFETKFDLPVFPLVARWSLTVT